MQVLSVVVEGYLSEDYLVKVLAPVDAQLARSPAGAFSVVIDILRMTGYSPEARSAYIAWHQRFGSNVKGVAVVTTNRLWKMVIAAIGITINLRAFDTPEEAARWAQRLAR